MNPQQNLGIESKPRPEGLTGLPRTKVVVEDPRPEELAALKVRMAGCVLRLGGTDVEESRRAGRELSAIAHECGQSGKSRWRRWVSDALLAELGTTAATQARRQLIWMVSEVSGDEAVAPLAALLLDEEFRDDARMALERIPGDRSLKALDAALGKVPVPFRRALAVSLRARGHAVAGLPSHKLRPSRETRVQVKAAKIT